MIVGGEGGAIRLRRLVVVANGPARPEFEIHHARALRHRIIEPALGQDRTHPGGEQARVVLERCVHFGTSFDRVQDPMPQRDAKGIARKRPARERRAIRR